MMWVKEGEVGGSETREESNKEYGRQTPARAIVVGSNREQSVTSNDGRPATCGAESVGSADGNDAEQQCRAARA